MNAMALPGVRFEATRFMSVRGTAKYPSASIPAIRFVMTHREVYRPVRTVLLFIDLVRRMHPGKFRWQERGAGVDRLAGTDALRKAIAEGRLDQVLADWEAQSREFLSTRREYLLYE
jgi:uncharacterized protein YbbC (DUF1343 family)